MKIDYCIISAGGEGSRLANLTRGIPKPIFPVRSISCLERSIILILKSNIKKLFISISFNSETIIKSIETYRDKYNIDIEIFEEKIPLGECGCIWKLSNKISGNILFLNGDLIWNIDLDRFLNFHLQKDSDITLVTHTSTHPEDSDLIMESLTNEISEFSLKPHIDINIQKKMFLGNSGIALFNSKILKEIPSPAKKISFCNHVLQNKINNKIRVFSYNTSEYIKDMGTEKRFNQVLIDIDNGDLVDRCYKKKQKCLFLDRDNTLITCPENKYITTHEQIRFKIKAIKLISQIRKDFDLTIIVTNQPQISMGLITWEKVNAINTSILSKCLELGLHIDALSICPHHPHAGFKNEVKYLKVDCFCRKPRPGLILKEAFLRNIDLEKSLLIGDSINDELAAKNSGIKFLHVSEI